MPRNGRDLGGIARSTQDVGLGREAIKDVTKITAAVSAAERDDFITQKRRRHMTKLTWMLCLAIGCGSLAMAAGDATAGKAVYDKACKSCHGADGTPNPGIAKSMKVTMAHLGDAS